MKPIFHPDNFLWMKLSQELYDEWPNIVQFSLGFVVEKRFLKLLNQQFRIYHRPPDGSELRFRK